VGRDEVIVLDTHAAVWLVTDDPALGKVSRRLIATAAAENSLAVSAITFWEIGLLMAKRRLDWSGDAAALRAIIINAGIAELPLTGHIALLSVDLERLHGDPADRFIAATAIVHGATLMTADTRLLTWRHKLVRHNAAT
jgi:PIN domain nuclease of toxin-antitoxin system